MKRLNLYSWFVGLGGLSVTFYYGPDVFLRHNLILTLCLFALAILLEALPVPLGPLISSLLPAMPIGAMVVYGTGEAIWTAVIAGIVAPMITPQKQSFLIRIFNSGQYVLSVFIMTRVYYAFSHGLPKDFVDWTMFFAILAASAVFILVNHLFINVITFLRGQFTTRVAFSVLVADSLNILIAIPFSFLMITLGPSHPLLGPISMLPIIVLAYTLRVYRKTRDMQVVHTATTELAAEFDVREICNKVSRVAKKLSAADAVVIFRLNHQDGKLYAIHSYPEEIQQRDFSGELKGWSDSEGGVIWEVLKRHDWEYVEDTRKDPRVRFDGKGKYYLSMAIFPMHAHNEPQGAIVCYAERSFAFPDSTDYISTLAAQTSVLLENARLYQELQTRSQRDGATGLYNYRYFYEQLALSVRESVATRKSMSVAVIDIDFFKKFNDTYGHLAGDEVLRAVGKILQHCCGRDAVVARYGGEEFSLILPMSAADAYQILENIRSQVMRLVVNFQGYTLQGITVSAGLASCPAQSINDRDLLLKADSAMYWGAKQRGRNRTVLYSPEFDGELFVDELTGLYTFHYMTTRIREEVASGTTVWGVVCIDLAHFGLINTRFGFKVGDKVLQQTGMLIRESLRHNELACRFGGDEVLVLLPNMNTFEIEAVEQRVAHAIMTYPFEGEGNIVFPVRAKHVWRIYKNIEDAAELFNQVDSLFADLHHHTEAESFANLGR
jgi:diguanylate cyclase (GGDEF)-like protein